MPLLSFFRKDRRHAPPSPPSPTTTASPSTPSPSTLLTPPPPDPRPTSPFARLAKRTSRSSIHSSRAAKSSRSQPPPPLPLSSTSPRAAAAAHPPPESYSPLLPPPRIFGVSFGNGSTQSLPPAMRSPPTPASPTGSFSPASASAPSRPGPTPAQQSKQGHGLFHSWKRHPKHNSASAIGLPTPSTSGNNTSSSALPPRAESSMSHHKRDTPFSLKSFRPIRPPTPTNSPPPTLPSLGMLPSPLSMSPTPSPSASQLYVASPTSDLADLRPPQRPRAQSTYSDSSSVRSSVVGSGATTTVGLFKQQARRSSTNVSVIPTPVSAGTASPPVTWKPLSPSSPPNHTLAPEATPDRPPRSAAPRTSPGWQAATNRRRSAALAAAWRGADTSTSDESEGEEDDDETEDNHDGGLGRQGTITQAWQRGKENSARNGERERGREREREKEKEKERKSKEATLVRMNSDGRPAWQRRATSPTASSPPAAGHGAGTRGARPRPEIGRRSLDTAVEDARQQQPPTSGVYANRRASASATELVRPVSIAGMGGVSPVKSAMKKPSPSTTAFPSGSSTTTTNSTTGAATGSPSSSDSDDVPLGVRQRVLSNGALSPPRAPGLQNEGAGSASASGRSSPASAQSSPGRVSAGQFRRQSVVMAGGAKTAPAVLGRAPPSARRASDGAAEQAEPMGLHKRGTSESSFGSSSAIKPINTSPSTVTRRTPPPPPSAYSPLPPPLPPPWSDSPGSSAGGSAVSARSSGSGSGSRGRGPLTPRDGMGVEKRSVSFVGVVEVEGKQEERRRERRRSEAKAAIELANIVNGPGPSLTPDDTELPPPLPTAPAAPMSSLAQSGLLNPLFPASAPPPMSNTTPFPTFSPPSNPYFLPQAAPGMNPYFPPTPTLLPTDPYLAAAHQQALLIARQTFQYTMAQQAMSAAGAAWDMNMGLSVGSASGLGTPAGSVLAGSVLGMSGSEMGWSQTPHQQQQQQPPQQQPERRQRRESLMAFSGGQQPQHQPQQARPTSHLNPSVEASSQQHHLQPQGHGQAQNPNRMSRAVPPVQMQTARGRSW